MQVKAAVTLGYQQPFVIKDVEVAPPGKDEILVKIVATGVCHTDAFTLSGSIWPYALLSCAISLAALGYGLLVSVLAKTTEQAVVLGGGGIIIMAALGGIMVPAYVMPDSMHTISQISPMAWALQAFHQLLLNRHGFAQVQHSMLLLVLFGAACLLLAAAVYRKQLKTQVRF